jgi:hypothetical protein
MAVVERAEREVVVEFGVPLVLVSIDYGVIEGGLTALQWEYRGWKEVLACRSGWE